MWRKISYERDYVRWSDIVNYYKDNYSNGRDSVPLNNASLVWEADHYFYIEYSPGYKNYICLSKIDVINYSRTWKINSILV